MNTPKNWWLGGLLVLSITTACWLSYSVGVNSGDYKIAFSQNGQSLYWQAYKISGAYDYGQAQQASADVPGNKECGTKPRQYLSILRNNVAKLVVPVCDNAKSLSQ
jgi:hypothetical protein